MHNYMSSRKDKTLWANLPLAYSTIFGMYPFFVLQDHTLATHTLNLRKKTRSKTQHTLVMVLAIICLYSLAHCLKDTTVLHQLQWGHSLWNTILQFDTIACTVSVCLHFLCISFRNHLIFALIFAQDHPSHTYFTYSIRYLRYSQSQYGKLSVLKWLSEVREALG